MDADKDSDEVYTVFNDAEGPLNFIENVNWVRCTPQDFWASMLTCEQENWDFYVRTIKQ